MFRAIEAVRQGNPPLTDAALITAYRESAAVPAVVLNDARRVFNALSPNTRWAYERHSCGFRDTVSQPRTRSGLHETIWKKR